MPQRNHSIDLLRALSVIYIVGYWHLFDYVPNFPGYANLYTKCLIKIILGIFALTSGYLLANRPIQLNYIEITEFYRRRLLRIYPLYALALFLFWWANLASSTVILKGAVLISMFAPPAPPTLWFITMIMVFYLIAPILIHYADRFVTYLAICGLILIGLIGYHNVIQRLDLRILMYFPAFAAGITIARNAKLQQLIHDKTLIITLMLIPAFWLFTKSNEFTVLGAMASIPAILIGSIIFLVYTERYANKYNYVIANISYASFCMYLLHRVVYKYIIMLYFPHDFTMQVIYSFILGVGISFMLAYWIQKLYDQGLTIINDAR